MFVPKKVSPFSATMIGLHDDSNNVNITKQIFMEEAKQVNQLTRNIHPSRKISHQQTNYPETVSKLSSIMSRNDLGTSGSQYNFNASFTGPSLSASSSSSSFVDKNEKKQKAMDFKNITLKQHQDSLNQHIQEEHHANLRKRVYNRELGRKSIVNEILSGTGSSSTQHDYLFPQHASHEQILAITGTLKASNPNIIPPEVPARRKWKGDNEGWGSP